MLWLFFGLVTKHFLADFPLQVAFHYKNKGTYGHVGGLIHALMHGWGTAIVLVLVNGLGPFWTHQDMAFVAFMDVFIHYHVDWAKMNLNAYWKLKPDNSEFFWWLLGLDQYLHYLTYLCMAMYLMER